MSSYSTAYDNKDPHRYEDEVRETARLTDEKIDTTQQKAIFYAENKISNGWNVSIDMIVEVNCGLFRDVEFM